MLIHKSPDVFSKEGPITTIGAEDVEMLRKAVSQVAKGRVRINVHPSTDDLLHEMIIAMAPSSYICPHKHPGKSEAFHIIEGEVDVVIFDDSGEIMRVISLAAKGGLHPFYYRMSAPYFHALIVRSDLLVIHEITNGPFRPSDTVFASFAPDELDAPAARAYQAKLIKRVAAFMGKRFQHGRRHNNHARIGDSLPRPCSCRS
jgi:cupin fold WbuC family metalloprotein